MTMTSTPITTIPNRPAGKPVFDYQLDGGRYARVPLATVSNDGQTLVVSGWAYLIDATGVPVLDPATATPTGTADGTNNIVLSGVLAGTHTLYDGWTKYIPPSGQSIDADHLPAGWASGSGAPAVPSPAPAYGSGYYDTTGDQGYVWSQGELNRVSQGYADALSAQIDTAAKLAALGL
jgi:hypothetical protein